MEAKLIKELNDHADTKSESSLSGERKMCWHRCQRQPNTDMKNDSNAGSGCQTRFVRLLLSVWDDVGLPPKDAAMAFVAGLLVACPVMGIIWITAWCLCKMTGKPMDDNAFTASVGVLFCFFLLCRAVGYAREKWRESGKPNAGGEGPPP